MDHAALLQALYDSEINWEIACFFDGGFHGGSATK